MAALSTQERNAAVESSRCSNMQPVPLAKRTSFDGGHYSVSLDHGSSCARFANNSVVARAVARRHDQGADASDSQIIGSECLDGDRLPARVAHDECEIAAVFRRNDRHTSRVCKNSRILSLCSAYCSTANRFRRNDCAWAFLSFVLVARSTADAPLPDPADGTFVRASDRSMDFWDLDHGPCRGCTYSLLCTSR